MPYRASHYLNAQAQLIKHIDAARPPFQLGWAPNYVFSQPPLERALRGYLQVLPHVEVRLGREVTGFTQRDGQVSVSFNNPDGSPGQASAAWLLACDGGTSPIRTHLS